MSHAGQDDSYSPPKKTLRTERSIADDLVVPTAPEPNFYSDMRIRDVLPYVGPADYSSKATILFPRPKAPLMEPGSHRNFNLSTTPTATTLRPVAVLKLFVIDTIQYALCSFNDNGLYTVPASVLELSTAHSRALLVKFKLSRLRPYQIAVPGAAECEKKGIEIPQYEEISTLYWSGEPYVSEDGFIFGCDCEQSVKGGCAKPARNAKAAAAATAAAADSSGSHEGNDFRKNCSCLEYGHAYQRNMRLKDTNTHQIVECNSQCKCNNMCSNRVVQIQSDPALSPLLDKLILHHQSQKGWSVFTTVNIPRGTFITQYLGDILTPETIKERELEYNRLKLSTTYSINIENFESNSSTYTIDALYRGNISRFYNHSCNPNMLIRLVYYDMPVTPSLARIGFFAYRDILANEELTFDYEGKFLLDKIDVKNGKCGAKSKFSFKCACGSNKCRKIILS